MKKRIMLIGLTVGGTLLLGGCLNSKTSNVSSKTQIEDVNQKGKVISGEGELTGGSKETKATISDKNFVKSLEKEFEKNPQNALENIIYNAEIVKKENPQLYEKAKKMFIQEYSKKLKTLLNEIDKSDLPPQIKQNLKQKIINGVKKIDYNNNPLDLENFYNSVLNEFRTTESLYKVKPQEVKNDVKQKIETKLKINHIEKIKDEIKPDLIKSIKFGTNYPVKITTNEILDYLKNKIKIDLQNLTTVNYSSGVRPVFIPYNNLAKIINGQIGVNKKITPEGVNIDTYFVYGGKKFDISLAGVYKQLKDISKFININNIKIPLMKVNDIYMPLPIFMDKLQDLYKDVVIYEIVKNNPDIIKLVVNVYQIKPENQKPEVIYNYLVNLITQSFIDYTNITSINQFNKLLDILGQYQNIYF